MNDTSKVASAEQQMREMNEALLVSAVRLHEVAAQAEKAEAALRDSEVRYRRLFQSAKDGILILDANTRKIIDANAFMSGLLGQELPELVGKELYEIGMFEDEAASKTAFTELQQNGYIRYDHLPLQRANGETTQVELVSNIYEEDRRLLAQCTVRDITARAAMEQQIKKQAEALADQAHRKDEFLAMLSHELRNPLAPIRSALHLLKLQESGSENPIQQRARKIIERQVGNLTKLVSDLMEVSRVISGRIRLDLQPVDLKQIVEHAFETTAPLLERRKHTVSVNLCSEHLWARADSTRLEEVLVNLLDNASKYTPDGGTIEVGCERHQGHALVRVRDNGVGIDKELLPRIFDLFTQADRSLDRAEGGLGIGLSLAHRLIELHGGTIEAYSPPEGHCAGSEFIVRLPLEAAPELQLPQQPVEDASTTSGLRILVVDDNFDLVTVLTNILQAKGFHVQSAHDGTDGLRMAKEWRPDIVLLDIGLPGLDGYDVARRLRSDLGGGVRLIAISGYGSDTDIALAREVGFDGHLTKPFDFGELEKLMSSKPDPSS